MASPIPNTHGIDFIGPLGGHQRNTYSESEKGSDYSHDYRPTGTQNSSHEVLNKYHSIYHTSNRRNHEFKSYLLDEKIQKPWIEDKKYKLPRRGNWIIVGAIVLAVAGAGVLNWRIAAGVPNFEYCLVLDDSFSSLDSSVWSHQVQVDGFNVDSFDWTTTDPLNAFTDEEGLHIVPTLTTATTQISDADILNGFSLDLTANGDGSCTANQTAQYYMKECSIQSNLSSNAIIPPVRSARLTTQASKSIQYGRVEVVAKMPQGDWLWPGIFMMPSNSVYGTWPLSGEIDIAESRGNSRSYKGQGREYMSSSLHWGPSWNSDSWRKTTHYRNIQRTDYSEGFHTFGLEWSKDYLYTWVDNRLQQVLYVDFKKQNMWQFGKFAGQYENGSLLTNPWFTSANNNAPFDQDFFLVLDVAVGGRNGYFPDGVSSKPWVDGRDSAASDFYAAKSDWYPTWGSGSSSGMTVKSVKMWQQGKCQS